MHMKRYLLSSMVAISMMMGTNQVMAQQVPLFNQYFNANSLAYPSAGVFTDRGMFSLIYRDQFGGLVGSPQNYALAYSTPLGRSMAFNGNVTSADIGFTSQIKVSGGLGFKLFGKEGNGLSIGSQVSLSFFNLNEDRVNPENPVDNALAGLLGQNGSSLSVDFSASYRYKAFSIDLAVPTVLNESLSDDAYIQINDDNVPDFIGGAAYEFMLNPKLTLKPYAGIRLRETIGAEIDLMAEVNYNEKLSIRAGYRDNYGFTGGIGIRINEKLEFTYSYDIGQRDIPFLADGFSEFGLHFRLKKKQEEAQEGIDEGEAVVNRIIDEKIYDDALVSPQDKEKALDYLASIQEGNRKQRNLKADSVYQALIDQSKAAVLAQSESQRQSEIVRDTVSVEKAEEVAVANETEESVTEKASEEETVIPVKVEAAKPTNSETEEEKEVLPQVEETVLTKEKEAEIDEVFELATSTITFKSNSNELRLKSIPSLNQVYELLLANPALKIEVNGHTDSSGNAEANQRLSLRRAQRVKSYMVNKGIAAERIKAQGFGSSQPLKSNDYDWGRALNRRVELRIIKD